MKITLPENIAEITLGQFQRYMDLLGKVEDMSIDEFNRRKIEIFVNVPRRNFKNISQKDFEYLLNQIDKAMNTDVEFIERFSLNGIEYGFHPNLDDLSIGEWADLSSFGEGVEELHKVMTVLFRPIVQSDKFKNYKIASYTGDEDSELLRKMPLNVVNGALVFFCNLAKELQTSIQRYTTQAQQRAKKHQTTSISGDGMPQSVI
jgi:hypothetical protein